MIRLYHNTAVLSLTYTLTVLAVLAYHFTVRGAPLHDLKSY